MNISITGVTANRKFTKACVRLRWILERLRRCCEDVDTGSERFDVLQVVFMDRPENFLEIRGTQDGDRLNQVHVGMGIDRTFDSEHDYEFLRLVAEQVLRAVRQSPLGVDVRDDAIARVEQWRDSLADDFHDAIKT